MTMNNNRMPTDLPRRPGRPRRPAGRRSTSAAGQRQVLLDAALLLFSRQGVAATSLKSVAQEAGVTAALLHYYFGTREQLLDVVVQERLLPLLAGILQGGGGAGYDNPRSLVRSLVPLVMETVTRNPWLPPLWVREVLTDGGLLRERVMLHGRILAPLLRDKLVAAQREGQINPGLDPRLLLVSIIGLTLFPFAAAPIWRQLFDAGDITTETLVNHTLSLLEQGVFTQTRGKP